MVKNLSAVQEMQFQPLGEEDPLEKEMTTHFSMLAWRIPWTEEASGLQFMGPVFLPLWQCTKKCAGFFFFF